LGTSIQLIIFRLVKDSQLRKITKKKKLKNKEKKSAKSVMEKEKKKLTIVFSSSA